MLKPYEIDKPLPYKHPSGITYRLLASGPTWSTITSNAKILEIGDDGKVMTSYNLVYASEEVMEAVFTLVSQTLLSRPSPGAKVLLHPDTHKLTIRAKHDLGRCHCEDFYDTLNCMFKMGYGPLSEKEITEIKEYVERRLMQ